jgi:prepilin-type N-terminal cleavage/methylation domain-containing protein
MPKMRTLFPIHAHSGLYTLKAARAGFTMLEMILVLGVMAILVAVTSPAVFDMINRSDTQKERNAQQELVRAIAAYQDAHQKLPAMSTWVADLRPYTTLGVTASNNEILNDVWGQKRTYIVYEMPRTLQGQTMMMSYISVHSKGHDQVAAAAPGIAITGQDFAPTTDAAWWSNSITPAPENVFAALKAGGDDVMTTLTDYEKKMKAMAITATRMERVIGALEAKAKARFAEELSFCDDTANAADTRCATEMAKTMKIYIPRSLPTQQANTDNPTTYALLTNGPAQMVNNADTDANRRAQMEILMMYLGLPKDFCCSALDMSSDNKPKPFYYFSNPRPRLPDGTCGNRPDVNTPKLPARLTTVNDARTCG